MVWSHEKVSLLVVAFLVLSYTQKGATLVVVGSSGTNAYTTPDTQEASSGSSSRPVTPESDPTPSSASESVSSGRVYTTISTDVNRSSTSTSSGNRSSTRNVEREPDFMNSLDAYSLNSTAERQVRIEMVKRDILNRLGMTQVPDVSRVNMTVQERRQILRLYRKSVEELHGKMESSLLFADDQFYANQFRSFTEMGGKPSSVPDRIWTSTVGKRIYFAVDIPEPADPRKETIVKSAKLKLFKREVRARSLALSDTLDNSLRIEIYQIIQQSGDMLLRRSIDSRLVSLAKTGWEEFDVARAVQDWIRDPASNLGLEIACDIRYRMEDVVSFVVWSPPVVDNPNQSSMLPILNVLTHEKRILGGRQKRDAIVDSGDCTTGETRCCRHPLTINFSDIGWDSWVIEPTSYQAYYCQGTCPVDYRVAHRYSRLKSLMRDRLPTTPVRVHCMETKMGSINIAHYNSDNILVVSVFDNMFPTECMCA